MSRHRDPNVWEHGATVEIAWAHRCRSRGCSVLPVYALGDLMDGIKAPLLFAPDCKLIAPDLLVFSKGEGHWHEIKAKSGASWHRGKHRWEHGIDYRSAMAYQRVQELTGFAVWIVVQERKSPTGERNVWLVARLDDVIAKGEHRPKFPGKGGGWLWARDVMTEVAGA